MILRTKNGQAITANISIMLEYLGVKKEAAGIQKVSGDVELIASVPFSMSNEQLTVRNEELALGNVEGFEWTLSTFDLDRFGERIDPMGWDFSQYAKNPVVEWAHNYLIPAIGKIEGLAIDNDGLHGFIVFNEKEYDPFGWSIGERVKNGVIRAGSVGFRVLEIEIPSKDDSKDGTSLIFRKQELLEFSICNVPANPYALAKGMGNREWGVGKERGDITALFWGGLINNLQE